jgi:hypothetical protein
MAWTRWLPTAATSRWRVVGPPRLGSWRVGRGDRAGEGEQRDRPVDTGGQPPQTHGSVGHVAIRLADGRVLVAGGGEGHTATLLPNGKVLVTGGGPRRPQDGT